MPELTILHKLYALLLYQSIILITDYVYRFGVRKLNCLMSKINQTNWSIWLCIQTFRILWWYILGHKVDHRKLEIMKNKKMERKQAQIYITLMFVITISINLVAAENKNCPSDCTSRCRNSPNFYQCYDDCLEGCLPPNHKLDLNRSYYCKLGCSLHKCTSAINGSFLEHPFILSLYK